MSRVLDDSRVSAALILMALLLSGCASTRLIDTRVSSFAPQLVAPGSDYQFERLPSQMADPVRQSRLEQLAERALGKVGLKWQNAAALNVQVSAFERQEYAGYPSGVNIGWGLVWVFGHGAISVGGSSGFFPGLDAQTSYWRQVSLLIRNAAAAVVFESHASHDGVWSDSDAVLAAMLDAALQGFPSPPTGMRSVNIEIPR